MMVLYSLFYSEGVRGQGFCQFDESYNQLIDSGYLQIYEENEVIIQQGMNNPQAIMNGEVYTIPIVFHVIHLGESIGVGSNISDASIFQALQDLNDDFRDVLNIAHDVKIEFCLAKQDPQGNATTGITRNNGSSISEFIAAGLNSSNEIAVKGLNNWPNTDYINIWVVHNIYNANLASIILGKSTFPGTSSLIDGISLRADITGTSAQSGVFAHELGHFFNLFHTFNGGNETTCAPNNNCELDGDKICDTSPHKLVYGGCDIYGTNSCDNTSNSQIVHNHMNYTDNDCKYQFTNLQTMRMRCALMNLRSELIVSVGCSEACSSSNANFEVTGNDFPIGSLISFQNTSTNSTEYQWYINSQNVNSSYYPDFRHFFNDGGLFNVCLIAKNENCKDKYCEKIKIFPLCISPSDQCEKVINGDFEQINGTKVIGTEFLDICGWDRIQSTPFYCNTNTNNLMGLFIHKNDIERMTLSEPITFSSSQSSCTIEFDYVVGCLVSGCSPPRIQIAFVDNNTPIVVTSTRLPTSASIIASVTPENIDIPEQNNNECPFGSPAMHHYFGTFDIPNVQNVYLTVTGTPMGSKTSIFFIDNISITCCESGNGCVVVPNFTYNIENCSASFQGSGLDEDGEYYWDFGDGSYAIGQNVSHTYIYSGPKNVCLTISCDSENSFTECKELTISEVCDNCEEELIIASAIQCQPDEETIESSYLSNFSIQVEKGYTPCGSSFFVGSNQISITSPSYFIDETNSLYDIINVALIITPPIGYDFNANGANGHITLCGPNGEFICYEISINATSCDYCYVIETPVNASCILTESYNGVYIYNGTISGFIDAPTNIYSTSAGLTIGSNGSFQITTTTQGAFVASAILVFIADGVKTCYRISIVVSTDDACPPDCIPLSEDILMVMCEEEMIGDYTIFLLDDIQIPNGFVPCRQGLSGNIDDGIVSIVSKGLNVYGVEIQMFPTYNIGVTYTLILTFCNEDGIEFEFCADVVFMCGRGDRMIDTRESYEHYMVSPNPVKDRLEITCLDKLDFAIANKTISVLNLMGKTLKEKPYLLSTEYIDVADLPVGGYIIAIKNADFVIYKKLFMKME